MITVDDIKQMQERFYNMNMPKLKPLECWIGDIEIAKELSKYNDLVIYNFEGEKYNKTKEIFE